MPTMKCGLPGPGLHHVRIAPPGERAGFRVGARGRGHCVWDGRQWQGAENRPFFSVRAAAAAAGGPREDYNPTLNDFSELADQLLALKLVVRKGYREVGPDMRDRVDRLYDRVQLLRNSAEQAPGARISAQLIATLRAMQREYVSLENIVNKALDAGPLLDAQQDSSPEPMPLDDESPKMSAFQTLVRQSDVEELNLPPPPEEEEVSYVMTSPVAFGSSPLASFRSEIEKRVLEQLLKKKLGSSGGSTSKAPAENGGAAVSGASALPVEFSGQGRSTYKGTAQAPLDAAALGVEEVERRAKVAEAEGTARTAEVDRLRVEMVKFQTEVKAASVRAEVAEAQVRSLSAELSQKIAADVHEETIRKFRESLAEARLKVTQMTTEAKEKEMMLDAVKKQLLGEQERLLAKVAELTGELATRVKQEEMEAAITAAVEEVQAELVKAKRRAWSLTRELEEKERLVEEMRARWDREKALLQEELATVNARFKVLEDERDIEQAQLLEARETVRCLEDEVAKLRVRLVEDDSRKSKPRRAGSRKRTKGEDASKGAEDSDFSDEERVDEEKVPTASQKHPLSEQKVVALERFFTMMGKVIKQEVIPDSDGEAVSNRRSSSRKSSLDRTKGAKNTAAK